MRYLSETQLYRMKHDYKYQTAGLTWLEKIALQPFWNWIAEHLPMTWAPNSITLASFVQMIVPTVLVYFASKGGTVEAPGWTCVLVGLGVFGWMTLDAVDGKQARRTKSGSPMGEIFDHGCDNFTLLAMVRYCLMCIFGTLGANSYLYTILGMLSHWVSFLTYANRYGNGIMVFSDFGVSELQLTYTFLFAGSGLIGASVWNTEIVSLGLRSKELAVYCTMLLALFNIAVLLHKLCTTPGATKLGSVANTHVLSPLPALAIAHSFVLLSGTKDHLTSMPYIVTLDLIAIKLCNKITVDVITTSKFPVFDSSQLYLCLFTINHVFQLTDPDLALWLTLGCTVADVVGHWLCVCVEMAEYLHINMFSITTAKHA